jgi:hypothetical protein
MTRPLDAALELHEFLTSQGITYAIIGGLAVQQWGAPRLTQDLDLTVSVPLGEGGEFAQLVTSHFASRVSDPVAFARQTRMLLIRASNGCEVDISLSVPGYEDDLMRRSIEQELAPGRPVKMCSAEDLIIHKAVAGRPVDIQDIEGVVYRQADALDIAYIRRWLHEFASVLEEPDIVERFERPWGQLHVNTD